MHLVNLNTTTKLSSVGKEYKCFKIDGKSTHAAKCVKSRIITKVIACVLSINKFEQQCVMLKGMLKPIRLKNYVKTIGIDQSLSNSALFEHRCIHNINKLYKHTRKFDDQQKFKDIIEADMVFTPEGFTNNSPISTMIQTPVNKTSS